jgi:hypothetical protein
MHINTFFAFSMLENASRQSTKLSGNAGRLGTLATLAIGALQAPSLWRLCAAELLDQKVSLLRASVSSVKHFRTAELCRCGHHVHLLALDQPGTGGGH